MTFCELLLLLSTFKATFYEIILHLFEYTAMNSPMRKPITQLGWARLV